MKRKRMGIFLTDQKIIALYFQRDEEALTHTDKKYGKGCKSLSYNIVKSFEDCEECVNSSYYKVWDTVPPKRPDSLKVYLMKIVRNISINLYERNRTKKRGFGEIDLVLEDIAEIIPDNSSMEQISDDITVKNVINFFLSGLTEEKRNIFIMRFFYVKSMKEIAEELYISEGKVKMILRRLKDELRELLEKEGVEV